MTQVSVGTLLESYEEKLRSKTPNSAKLFERASKHLPGGVSGNAKFMRPYPIYIESAKGPKLWDIDGNEYIDTIMGAGSQILGHNPKPVIDAIKAQLESALTIVFATQLELQLAEKIQKHYPNMELLRFSNTGGEGVVMALRAARAYTGRDLIGKFEGNWHGQFDTTLVSGISAPQGPEDSPVALPDCAGIPEKVLETVLVLPYNNTEATCALIRKNAKKLAAVIIEPVCVFQCGVTPARREFLKAIREVTQANDIPLIFDEVITGFRLGIGGATELFGIKPDLCVLGKIIGGGLPVGAFGGRFEIMDKVVNPASSGSSQSKIFHSGTYTANPVSLAAGLAMLNELERKRGEIYPYIDRLAGEIRRGISAIARDLGVELQVNGIGSFYHIIFMDQPPSSKRDMMKADALKQTIFSVGMIANGVMLVPSHPGLTSRAHTDTDVKHIVDVAHRILREMTENGKSSR